MAESTTSRLWLVLALTLLLTGGLTHQVRPALASFEAPDVYAIKDARIIIGTGKTIAKGSIVVRNGLITDVGEEVRIPADARIIDGSGMTVYPGLIDAFTSLGIPVASEPRAQAGGGRQAALAAAAAGQQTPPEQVLGDPSLAAADEIKPGGTAIEDARSVGVTTALTSPRQGVFSGQSALIDLGDGDQSKLVVRAPVALTVQFGSGGGGFGGIYPGSLMGKVAFVRQSFYDAIHYRDELDRYNRVKRGVSRPEYDKKLAALQPALRGDLPVLFLANSDGDIRRALMIADEFKLKPIIAGALYSYRVIDLLKSKNVPVILSVEYPKRAADLPDDEDEPLQVLRDRAEAPKCAARLAQAGVKFAFTSGALRPQDFISNIQKAVENGLSRDDAVRALTVNAAEIAGTGEQLGAIEKGKIANLVVTSGDLLTKEAKVRHVFIDGNEIQLKKPETPPRAGGGQRGGPGGSPASEADPSGAWTLVVQSPQGEQTVRLNLHRDGNQIAGTMESHMGAADIKGAEMTGNQLRASSSIQMNGETIQFTMTAVIEGNSMRGSITIPGMGSFEFTGTRPR